MTDRIEELAKMAYEAWYPDAPMLWPDLEQADKELWFRIARTLYAAIMTEAAGVAEAMRADLSGPYAADPEDYAQDAALVAVATALLAKAKDAQP